MYSNKHINCNSSDFGQFFTVKLNLNVNFKPKRALDPVSRNKKKQWPQWLTSNEYEGCCN